MKRGTQMYNIKQNNQQTDIKFVYPSVEILQKTAPYKTEGVLNVMRSMVSQFLLAERTNFLVYVKKLNRWFHFQTRHYQDVVNVELAGVYTNASDLQEICASDSYGMYENSGILTKEIIETELH